MHDDAQRTMIGVVDALVRVRNLGHRQQRQKNHAHDRSHREGAHLPPASIVYTRLESGQHDRELQNTWI